MVFRLQREREGHGDACRACGMLIFLRLSTKTRRSGDHVWCRTRNADFDLREKKMKTFSKLGKIKKLSLSVPSKIEKMKKIMIACASYPH